MARRADTEDDERASIFVFAGVVLVVLILFFCFAFLTGAFAAIATIVYRLFMATYGG